MNYSPSYKKEYLTNQSNDFLIFVYQLYAFAVFTMTVIPCRLSLGDCLKINSRRFQNVSPFF